VPPPEAKPVAATEWGPWEEAFSGAAFKSFVFRDLSVIRTSFAQRCEGSVSYFARAHLFPERGSDPGNLDGGRGGAR